MATRVPTPSAPLVPTPRPATLRGLAILTLALLLAIPASGQTWARSFGDWRLAQQVRATADGGVVGLAWCELNGQDLWVCKWDAAARVEWAKAYGGTDRDEPTGVEPVADGYVVVGHTKSFAPTATLGEMWVLRLDGAGNVTWQLRWPGRIAPGNHGMTVTASGDIGIACYDHDAANRLTLTVLRVRPDGSLAWRRGYSLGGTSTADSIRALPDGGFLVTASTRGTGITGSAAWVLDLDPDGLVRWNTVLDNQDLADTTDRGISILRLSDGSHVLAGSSQSAGLETWLAGLGPTGALLWQQKYVEGATHVLTSEMVLAPDGGWTLAGYGDWPNRNAWMMHVNEDRSIAWQQALDGPTNGCASIHALADGYLLAVKDFTSGRGHQFLMARADLAGAVDSSCFVPEAIALAPQPTIIVATQPVVSVEDMALDGVPSAGIVTPDLPLIACDPCPPTMVEVSHVVAGDPPLLLSPGGDSVTVSEALGATAYNVYIDSIGSWYAPAATCAIRSFAINGDGTVTLPLAWSASSWIDVTASDPCSEGAVGTDSAGARRSASGTWAFCGPAP